MNELALLIKRFIESVETNDIDIYNEFSLQHELGIFLRAELPGFVIQFERNVETFAPSKTNFTKRELDIAVFSKDKTELKYAIELKYPRNGQYPEQMYSFCKDIAFAEELKSAGFSRTALLILVDDYLFYSGSGDGIYGYFRSSKPITGDINKPTGNDKQHIKIKGNHVVSWSAMSKNRRYAFIEV